MEYVGFSFAPFMIRRRKFSNTSEHFLYEKRRINYPVINLILGFVNIFSPLNMNRLGALFVKNQSENCLILGMMICEYFPTCFFRPRAVFLALKYGIV